MTVLIFIRRMRTDNLNYKLAVRILSVVYTCFFLAQCVTRVKEEHGSHSQLLSLKNWKKFFKALTTQMFIPETG